MAADTGDDGQPGIGAAGPAVVPGHTGKVGGQVWWWVTTRAEGDTSDGGTGFELAPPAGVPGGPWTWLDQVHGTAVVTATAPGEASGARADGAVTRVGGVPLALRTADCAPVVLAGPGTVGVAHAGWRGVLGGVIGAVAGTMAGLGGAPQAAVVGPCISAAHYAFSVDDLAVLVDRFGPEVEGRTIDDMPALDMRAAVRVALAEAGVTEVADVGGCTAAGAGRWFSHRARAEPQRMTTVAWLVG